MAGLAGMALDSLAAGNKSAAISKATRSWRKMEIIQLASYKEKSKSAPLQKPQGCGTQNLLTHQPVGHPPLPVNPL